MRRLITLLFVNAILFAFPAIGQDAAEYYRRGEEALLKKKYEQAAIQFAKALIEKPDMFTAQRGVGVAYEMMNTYDKAAHHYEKTLQSNPNFSRALYYQTAMAFYKSGNFAKALDYFYMFRDLQDNDINEFGYNGEKEEKIEAEYLKKLPGTIKACQVSMDSTRFLNLTEIINLGPNVNTRFNEYFPLLTNDQKTLFFNRQKALLLEEDLYISKRQGEKWSEAKPVRSFNTGESEGMVSMVRDGRRIYFTACNRETVQGPCDIWEALVNGEEVVDIKELSGFSNSEYWESQAAVSCDGSVLYFASDRPGGMGGIDLWVSKRKVDGTWSNPENLGPKINSAGDEESPFITNDGKTLYFSSTGHEGGMGEQDIFFSWSDYKTGEWSVPVGIGPPVNSAHRELGFFLSADGKTGYFSSDRPGGMGGMDIYKFELSDKLYSEPITFVEGYVLDSILLEGIQTTVNINGRIPIITDPDGRFFLCAGADEILDIQIDETKYLNYHNQFTIPEWPNRDLYRIELLLQSVESILYPTTGRDLAKKGGEVPNSKHKVLKEYLHTVFFAFDEDKMSLDELEKLEEFIKPLKGKEIDLGEVFGFADDIGTDAYNVQLSENRAKGIALVFIENGIVIDKIFNIEGKGEIKNGGTKEMNRRVEVRIIALE